MPSRQIFISHAVVDKDVTNLFVDHVLIGGIGISAASIFNVSAPSSPIDAGSYFSPHIQGAIAKAKVVIALISPDYYKSSYCMSELGAAWALKKLFPLLVPPIDFDGLTGALQGIQCVRIQDAEKLGSMYNRLRRFAKPSNDVPTFNAKVKSFVDAMQSRPQEPPTPTLSRPVPSQDGVRYLIKRLKTAQNVRHASLTSTTDPLLSKVLLPARVQFTDEVIEVIKEKEKDSSFFYHTVAVSGDAIRSRRLQYLRSLDSFRFQVVLLPESYRAPRLMSFFIFNYDPLNPLNASREHKKVGSPELVLIIRGRHDSYFFSITEPALVNAFAYHFDELRRYAEGFREDDKK